MSTIRWNLAIPAELDRSVRMYIAAQGGGRRGDLTRFVEESVRARLLESAVDQAKEATTAAGLNEQQVSDLIDEAVDWARSK